ncbi:MAG: replicative DNA helicase, partial [Oscillospiraceae bacterium]|nr:replicative DNA helicase [Oscillospiraceae bacterium]
MEFADIVSAEMPHSTEAEQTVLGAVLMDPEQLSVVMEYLKADSFYIPK